MLTLLLGGCVSQNPSQPRTKKVHLTGKIVGGSYVSRDGEFSVPIPVSPEVGGRVLHDNPTSVTFFDNWGSRISFYSRAFSAQSQLVTPPQSEARERALGIFMKDIYGGTIVPHYHSDALDGAITFIFLRPVGPKMGVATYIHKNRVYLVETDLLPGITVIAPSDNKSEADRDKWLENRALELLRTLEVK